MKPLHTKRRGFTLLEVLVATTIMGIAVVTLLSALSSSMSNASRVTEFDRAALVARRKVDELLLMPRMPRNEVLEGPLDPAMDGGFTGGWRARLTPFEAPPNPQPGMAVLDRLECEVWWNQAGKRKTFSLEAFRTTILTAQDLR